jgi:hypothetical protein
MSEYSWERTQRPRLQFCVLRGVIDALLFVTLMGVAGTLLNPASADAPCSPPQTTSEGWARSFQAACTDMHGRRAGGSQILHLVAHKGELFAGSGYWMDANNIRYGGTDPTRAWAQVLRLTGEDRAWTVDLDLGPAHMRTELLTSVSFSRDRDGKPLPTEDRLLLAATYDAGGMPRVFVRDDATGQWHRSTLLSAPTGRRGEDNSIRKAVVHQDQITGQEHLFLSVGVFGLLRADYDPSQPTKLRWSEPPEFIPERTRILGLAIVNRSLVVSDGQSIWRRIDGPQVRYERIADFSAQIDASTPRLTFSAIGGLRGLTAIEGPVAGQQSLLVVWHNGRLARGCVFRLDPVAEGAWLRREEICLADLAERWLGTPVSFVIGGYNEFLALPDPEGGTRYLTGMQAFLTDPAVIALTAANQRNRYGGYYSGALIALRDAKGGWRLNEVNGRFEPGRSALVAPYTAALSPFGGRFSQSIYFGGYDPNFFASTDTAWIFRGSLHQLLQP